MTITVGPYVAGELPEPLEYTFLDANGTAINLSSGWTATFQLKRGTSAAVTLPATTPTAAGKTTHVWLTGELVVGYLSAYFIVTSGTNTYYSKQILAYVAPALT